MPKRNTWIDIFILSIFTVLITFHPDYLRGELNLFELSLYLPGINAILHGQIPFRDFFHLRGPLELYMPAFMMTIFGKKIAVLSTYFYIGTVLGLIVCVLIAAQFYRSRWTLYVMAPVLIARTFPRIVFTFWGGMRFTWGVVALFFAIRFFKEEKKIWIFAAGMISALACLTSLEVGVASILGILAAITFAFLFNRLDRREAVKAGLLFAGGWLTFILPYCGYLAATHSLRPYIDDTWAVVVNMQKVIDMHLISVYPKNVPEFIAAMVNPHNKNFRQMTPIYLYIVLSIYLLRRIRNRILDWRDLTLVCLGVYGVVLYSFSVRMIWGQQFEMALQPEKILLFYILETVFLFALKQRKKILISFHQEETPISPVGKEPLNKNLLRTQIIAIYLFFFIVIGSSVGYTFGRYIHVKKKEKGARVLLAEKIPRELNIPRGQGMVVSSLQAEEIETIVNFVQGTSSPEDIVVMYPDSGIYNFLFDRSFLDRFPVPVMSWFDEDWHRDFVRAFKTRKPKFVIIPQKFPELWETVHLTPVQNRQKYNEVLDLVHSDYVLDKTTPMSYIYRIKSPLD